MHPAYPPILPAVPRGTAWMPRGSALAGPWKPSDFDDDDIQGIVPIPTSNTTVFFALIGATLAAVSGRDSPKHLLLGASTGAVLGMIIFAATGRW